MSSGRWKTKRLTNLQKGYSVAVLHCGHMTITDELEVDYTNEFTVTCGSEAVAEPDDGVV